MHKKKEKTLAQATAALRAAYGYSTIRHEVLRTMAIRAALAGPAVRTYKDISDLRNAHSQMSVSSKLIPQTLL